jgi:tRNA-splicing ligase RtcB
MPTKIGHVLNWASDIEGDTLAQAQRAGAMPFVEGYVALMPDAHFGLGATVGSVIPTRGAIMPAAVGVDIGCGMIAVETNLDASDLPESLEPLLSSISRVVPSGVGKGNERRYQALPGDKWLGLHPNRSVNELGLAKKATTQFGSLGSGNHFIEVCLDERDVVWVVLHSGSRGVGNQLARGHIDRAKGLMKERFIALEDTDLAYFVEGEPEFQRYVEDLEWAQGYAFANRAEMMDRVLRELAYHVTKNKDVDGRSIELNRINCHHNYTALENHHGKNLYITRKGAIRAREGDLGVIPGSMGAASYIVEGLGNPASFTSASHGAGRRMSRTKARAELDLDDFAARMEGRTWQADQAKTLLDEHPSAYKDIDQVMEDQRDLVVVKHTLRQVLNYKGT